MALMDLIGVGWLGQIGYLGWPKRLFGARNRLFGARNRLFERVKQAFCRGDGVGFVGRWGYGGFLEGWWVVRNRLFVVVVFSILSLFDDVFLSRKWMVSICKWGRGKYKKFRFFGGVWQ